MDSGKVDELKHRTQRHFFLQHLLKQFRNTTLPAYIAKVTDAEGATLVAGVRANLEQKPKSIAEKAELAALANLTRTQAVELLTDVLAAKDNRRRTIMLTAAKHAQEPGVTATFADRNAWKAKRLYR